MRPPFYNYKNLQSIKNTITKQQHDPKDVYNTFGIIVAEKRVPVNCGFREITIKDRSSVEAIVNLKLTEKNYPRWAIGDIIRIHRCYAKLYNGKCELTVSKPENIVIYPRNDRHNPRSVANKPTFQPSDDIIVKVLLDINIQQNIPIAQPQDTQPSTSRSSSSQTSALRLNTLSSVKCNGNNVEIVCQMIGFHELNSKKGCFGYVWDGTICEVPNLKKHVSMELDNPLNKNKRDEVLFQRANKYIHHLFVFDSIADKITELEPGVFIHLTGVRISMLKRSHEFYLTCKGSVNVLAGNHPHSIILRTRLAALESSNSEEEVETRQRGNIENIPSKPITSEIGIQVECPAKSTVDCGIQVKDLTFESQTWPKPTATDQTEADPSRKLNENVATNILNMLKDSQSNQAKKGSTPSEQDSNPNKTARSSENVLKKPNSETGSIISKSIIRPALESRKNPLTLLLTNTIDPSTGKNETNAKECNNKTEISLTSEFIKRVNLDAAIDNPPRNVNLLPKTTYVSERQETNKGLKITLTKTSVNLTQKSQTNTKQYNRTSNSEEPFISNTPSFIMQSESLEDSLKYLTPSLNINVNVPKTKNLIEDQTCTVRPNITSYPRNQTCSKSPKARTFSQEKTSFTTIKPTTSSEDGTSSTIVQTCASFEEQTNSITATSFKDKISSTLSKTITYCKNQTSSTAPKIRGFPKNLTSITTPTTSTFSEDKIGSITSKTSAFSKDQTSSITPKTSATSEDRTSFITPKTSATSEERTSFITPKTSATSEERTSSKTPKTSASSEERTNSITPKTRGTSEDKTSSITPKTSATSEDRTSSITPKTRASYEGRTSSIMPKTRATSEDRTSSITPKTIQFSSINCGSNSSSKDQTSFINNKITKLIGNQITRMILKPADCQYQTNSTTPECTTLAQEQTRPTTPKSMPFNETQSNINNSSDNLTQLKSTEFEKPITNETLTVQGFVEANSESTTSKFIDFASTESISNQSSHGIFKNYASNKEDGPVITKVISLAPVFKMPAIPKPNKTKFPSEINLALTPCSIALEKLPIIINQVYITSINSGNSDSSDSIASSPRKSADLSDSGSLTSDSSAKTDRVKKSSEGLVLGGISSSNVIPPNQHSIPPPRVILVTKKRDKLNDNSDNLEPIPSTSAQAPDESTRLQPLETSPESANSQLKPRLRSSQAGTSQPKTKKLSKKERDDLYTGYSNTKELGKNPHLMRSTIRRKTFSNSLGGMYRPIQISGEESSAEESVAPSKPRKKLKTIIEKRVERVPNENLKIRIVRSSSSDKEVLEEPAISNTKPVAEEVNLESSSSSSCKVCWPNAPKKSQWTVWNKKPSNLSSFSQFSLLTELTEPIIVGEDNVQELTDEKDESEELDVEQVLTELTEPRIVGEDNVQELTDEKDESEERDVEPVIDIVNDEVQEIIDLSSDSQPATQQTNSPHHFIPSTDRTEFSLSTVQDSPDDDDDEVKKFVEQLPDSKPTKRQVNSPYSFIEPKPLKLPKDTIRVSHQDDEVQGRVEQSPDSQSLAQQAKLPYLTKPANSSVQYPRSVTHHPNIVRLSEYTNPKKGEENSPKKYFFIKFTSTTKVSHCVQDIVEQSLDSLSKLPAPSCIQSPSSVQVEVPHSLNKIVPNPPNPMKRKELPPPYFVVPNSLKTPSLEKVGPLTCILRRHFRRESKLQMAKCVIEDKTDDNIKNSELKICSSTDIQNLNNAKKFGPIEATKPSTSRCSDSNSLIMEAKAVPVAARCNVTTNLPKSDNKGASIETRITESLEQNTLEKTDEKLNSSKLISLPENEASSNTLRKTNTISSIRTKRNTKAKSQIIFQNRLTRFQAKSLKEGTDKVSRRKLSCSVVKLKPSSPIKVVRPGPGRPRKVAQPEIATKVVRPGRPRKVAQPEIATKVVRPGRPRKVAQPITDDKTYRNWKEVVANSGRNTRSAAKRFNPDKDCQDLNNPVPGTSHYQGKRKKDI